MPTPGFPLNCLVCNRQVLEYRDGVVVGEHKCRSFEGVTKTTCKLGHRLAVVLTGSLPYLVRTDP
jgi:hypothetical protein